MKRKHSLTTILLLLLGLLLPLSAAAVTPMFSEPSIPAAARAIALEMNRQLEREYISEEFSKTELPLVSTVSVDINDLKTTNALARQMTEEVSGFLVASGYTLHEMRQGNAVIIAEKEGEFLLTRNVNELSAQYATGNILVGTYIITSENVRFTMSIIHAPENKILAKASATIPMTKEIAGMLSDEKKEEILRPSVRTKLN